jgi:hypothetical protein
MTEVYVKLTITLIASLVGILIMNKIQNRRIRQARERFEEMMKARGLDLEPREKDKK